MGVYFCLRKEITAVNQRKADGFALKFISVRAFQDYKRIVLVGRMSAQASDGLDPHFQAADFCVPFFCPGAGKLDHIIAVVRQIHAKTHGSGQMNRFVSFVKETGAPCDDCLLCKDGIEQMEAHAGYRILQDQRQRFGFFGSFGIGGGKPCKARLSGMDLVSFILEIADPASVFLQDLHSRLPVVAGTINAVFLPCVLQRKTPVIFEQIGRHGTGSRLQKIRVVFFLVDTLPKVQLAHLAVWQNRHNIADLIVK